MFGPSLMVQFTKCCYVARSRASNSCTTTCSHAILCLCLCTAGFPSTLMTLSFTFLACLSRRWICLLSCKTTPHSTSCSSMLPPSPRPPSSPPHLPCPPHHPYVTNMPPCTLPNLSRPLEASGRTSLTCRPRRTNEHPQCKGGVTGAAVEPVGTYLVQEVRPRQERSFRVVELCLSTDCSEFSMYD